MRWLQIGNEYLKVAGALGAKANTIKSFELQDGHEHVQIASLF
jgi:hypothetical protein